MLFITKQKVFSINCFNCNVIFYLFRVGIEAKEELAQVTVDIVDVVTQAHQVGLDIGHVRLKLVNLRRKKISYLTTKNIIWPWWPSGLGCHCCKFK